MTGVNYQRCPTCNKPFIEVERVTVGDMEFVTSKCGHSIYRETLENISDIKYPNFVDGRTFYPFQKTTHEMAVKADFRCLIANKMGYGKTINGIGLLQAYPERTLPALILCKKTATVQMAREVIRLTGLVPIVLGFGGDSFIPGFQVYICSHDLVRKVPALQEYPFQTLIVDECQQIKNPQTKRTDSIQNLIRGRVVRQRKDNPNLNQRKIVETMARDLMSYHGISERFKLSFEELEPTKLGMTECKVIGEGIISGTITISRHHAENGTLDDILETILHEIAHAITPGVGHKDIWRQASLSIGGDGQQFSWCTGTTEPLKQIEVPRNLVFLSGTPIKNHMAEYFTVLNALDAYRFPTKAGYIMRYGQYETTESGQTKIGGIRPDMIEKFERDTEDIVIRISEEEANLGLPPIRRDFKFFDMGNTVREAYRTTMGEFLDEMDKMDGKRGFAEMTCILAYLAKMRYITGMAKIDFVFEYVTDFIEQRPGEKICIFYHHKDVGTILTERISKFCKEQGIKGPINLTADTPAGAEIPFVEDPERVILLASTLAKGESLNLQVCSNAVMMERQWNPANEEQAEARFCRIGSTASSIEIMYPTAEDTVDEYLGKLVEDKRSYMASTIDHIDVDPKESNLIKELVEILQTKGRKAWRW